MKTTSFSAIPLAVSETRSPACQRSIHWLFIVAIALLLMLLTGCKHDVDPEKRPDPISNPPSSGTTSPGSGTTTQPDNATSTPPGSSTGNDGPVHAFRTFRITYATNDFQEVQYDAADQPVYYQSQATTMQGGNGMVLQRQFQFIYQANGQLQQVTQVGGNYFVYQYGPSNQISRVDEYTAKGRPLITRTYQYAANGQLVQLNHASQTDNYVARKTYQYDALGNLTTYTDWIKLPGKDEYRWRQRPRSPIMMAVST